MKEKQFPNQSLPFYPSKSSKMSGIGSYIIGEFVTTKAIHILYLPEYNCRYDSKKKTMTLDDLVCGNVNKLTATGSAS